MLRALVSRRAGIALHAIEQLTQHLRATLGIYHPSTVGPRRIVPHVLIVPAFKLRDPVLLVVLVETGNALVHAI